MATRTDTKKNPAGRSADGQPASRVRRFVPVFIAAVTVSAFLAGVWYAYDQGVKQGVRLKPPLIKAEPGPTKVVPENPGGLQVPNQDKQVFERITSTPEKPKVERLLPPQETPLPEEPDPIPVEPPQASAEVIKETQPTVEESETAASETAANVEPSVPAPTVNQDNAARQVVQAAKSEAAIEKPASPNQAVTLDPIRVQLAAFRSTEAAREGWKRLKRKHGALLSNLDPHVVKADLGAEKGIFYRLQAGPMDDKEAASRLCQELKAKKQPCLVVGPSR